MLNYSMITKFLELHKFQEDIKPTVLKRSRSSTRSFNKPVIDDIHINEWNIKIYTYVFRGRRFRVKADEYDEGIINVSCSDCPCEFVI